MKLDLRECFNCIFERRYVEAGMKWSPHHNSWERERDGVSGWVSKCRFSFKYLLYLKLVLLSFFLYILFLSFSMLNYCPVGWSCRIHWLHLCREVRPHQRVSWIDSKQSDGEVPVMLKLWGMQSTPSLPSLQGPLLPGVVAPNRVLSMGQIELNCVLMLN